MKLERLHQLKAIVHITMIARWQIETSSIALSVNDAGNINIIALKVM
tara:strand:- start:2474 stop:2614 length:141 start_codon:yes stop_codon:yes gene_type:complete